MKGRNPEDMIWEQKEDTSALKKLFKSMKVRAPIVATTEQLRAATKKAWDVLKLPAKDQRAAARKLTSVQRRVFERMSK